MRPSQWLWWGAILALFTPATVALVYFLRARGDRPPEALEAQEREAEERGVVVVQRLGGKMVRARAAPGQPVVAVHLGGTRVTDADLRELAGLRHLQALYLEDTAVTDVGLKDLAGLGELERLRLTRTPVGDAGVKELAGLKRLRTLGLRGTGVTDAGLKELAGLESLQEVDLTYSRVADAALKELARLKHLQTVSVPDRIEEEAIQQLLDNAIHRLARDGQLGTRGSRIRLHLDALPGWDQTKARLDRKSGHWFVTRNQWALQNGLAYPHCFAVTGKYEPSDHSWKQIWFFSPRSLDSHPGGGRLPYPAKRHEGRTVKEWADGLEEVHPDVIDRSGRGVQAFGDDGVPYLIVQARKHPPGADQRRLIAAFIHVPAPAAGEWRQAAIDFLHELLSDPAQPTRDGARNALKQAGLQ
jgi:hypothetical protein